MKVFEPINKAYNNTFKVNQLSIGIVVPIESYPVGAVPGMKEHLKRVKQVEELGFKVLWIRDVPFNVPSFGDVGQTFDPFTYLGYLAGRTSSIALGVASIALPLHHPVHIAKSIATIDQLSEGRLLMGVASGDRPIEYPAMGFDFEKRGEYFQYAFDYIRKAADDFPIVEHNYFGVLNGQIDILPKPTAHKVPMLITGYSRQSLDWNAEHGDGWIYYPRNFYQQQHTIREWRSLIPETQKFDKPFMQPLYVILEENDDFKPRGIQLGFRIGAKYLVDYLRQCQEIGVNHVALNLRFSERKMEEVLDHLAKAVLPHF